MKNFVKLLLISFAILVGMQSCSIKQEITIGGYQDLKDKDSFNVYNGGDLISKSLNTFKTSVYEGKKTQFYVRRNGYKTESFYTYPKKIKSSKKTLGAIGLTLAIVGLVLFIIGVAMLGKDEYRFGGTTPQNASDATKNALTYFGLIGLIGGICLSIIGANHNTKLNNNEFKIRESPKLPNIKTNKIYTKNVKIDFMQDDVLGEFIYNNKVNNKPITYTESFSGNLSSFSEKLNQNINAINKQDENQGGIFSNQSGIYLDCEIKKIRLKVYPEWLGAYKTQIKTINNVSYVVKSMDSPDDEIAEIHSAVACNWILKTKNGTILLSHLDTGISKIYFKTIQDGVYDAIENSMYACLNSNEAKPILDQYKIDENTPFKIKDKEKFDAALQGMEKEILIEKPKIDKTISAIKSVVKATVTIIPDDNSFGSGAIISSNGYILTNYHVVEENVSCKVKLSTGLTLTAKVVKLLKDDDLALLKIDVDDLPAIEINTASTGNDLVGEDIYLVGTPADKSLNQTITKGIISGFRTIEELDGRTFIQTDAAVNPGNSGGPMVTKDGKLVGIVVSKIVGKGLENIGFAIPIEVAIKKMNLKIAK